MMAVDQRAFETRRAVQKDIAIWDLIVWAFRDEKAQLDHPSATLALGRQMVSSSYLICQHEMLGCHIDGGGRSDPHPDADIVSAAVAVLPEGCGGWRMAMTLAELGRSAQMHPWSVPCLVSRSEFRSPRGGRPTSVALADEVDPVNGWPVVKTARGNVHRNHGRCCPVYVRGGPARDAAERRAYLLFVTALREVRDNLRIGSDLTAYRVSRELPSLTPWKETS